MNTKFILLAFTVLISKNLLAQDLASNFIEVTGTHKLEIIPDEIYLKLKIKEFKKEREIVKLDEIEKQIIKLISDLNIDKSSLTIYRTVGDEVRVKRNRSEFLLSRQYLLKLDSMDKLDRFIKSSEKVDLDYFELFEVNHSQLEKFITEGKVEAIKNGKMKAELYLSELNKSVGEVLEVKELGHQIKRTNNLNSIYTPEAVFRFSNVSTDYRDYNNLAVEKIKLEFAMYLKFKIE